MAGNLRVASPELLTWPRVTRDAADAVILPRALPASEQRFLLAAPKPPCECTPGFPCRACVRILNAIPAGPRL